MMPAEDADSRNGALVEMKIRSDGISVLAKAYDANGREMALPSKLIFYPQFFTVSEQVRLGTVEIFVINGSDKESAYRSALDISGRTGTLRTPRIEEKAAVIPMFMAEPRLAPNPNITKKPDAGSEG